MFIQQVSFQNFKCFREKTTVIFDQYHGINLITGAIGSGKTTIGEAILFGLFGSIKGKNIKDLITWGANHGCVEIRLETKGKILDISREINRYGQSPIRARVNGEPIIAPDKRGIQAILESEYYDVSRQILETTSIISFNNFRSISSLNTQATRDFLKDLTGAEYIYNYEAACLGLIRRIEQDIRVLDRDLESRKSQLGSMEDVQELPSIDIDQLGESVKSSEAMKKTIRSEHDEYTCTLYTNLNEYNKELGSVTAAGKRLKREIDFLKKGTCPTCGGKIDDSALPSYMKERDDLLEKFKDIQRKIDGTQAVIKKTNEEASQRIRLLDESIKEASTQIRTYRVQASALKERERLKKTIQDQIRDIYKEIDLKKNLLVGYKTIYSNIIPKAKEMSLYATIKNLNTHISSLCGQAGFDIVPRFTNQFDCLLDQNGISIPVSSLSTGQSKMVDMIIILAVVSSVIATNKCNVIFLDELFSNLDNSARSSMIALLRGIMGPVSSTFIVSHQVIDDVDADGVIQVSLDDDGARLG